MSFFDFVLAIFDCRRENDLEKNIQNLSELGSKDSQIEQTVNRW